MTGFAFAQACFGWRFLSRHGPRFFMGGLLGWAVFFWVKLILSAFIGLFVLPFLLYGMVRELRAVRAAGVLLS
jgi:hypothetical protein